MRSPCFLGLDIGTTSTIGVLIRPPGERLALEQRPVDLRSPRPGWAEEDPEQWWRNVCEITRALIETSGVRPEEIAAIGVAGMLPAVVLLDDQDRLLRPSIQQSDGRAAAEVEALRAEIDEAAFTQLAGNGVNQQLLAAKTRWLETHEPEVSARIATAFGSYDYINFRLTGEKRIEQNWALEAGLTDLRAGALSAELIAHTHLSERALPKRALSTEVIGVVSPRAAAETGLKAGTPVVGGAADFIASGLASGLARRGDCLLKFGGAIDVLAVSAEARPDPRLFLDYHLIPGLFVPNGCMATGGSALNWFAATLAGGKREAAREAGVSLHAYLDCLTERVPARADGVAIVPYFLGEKTPVHDARARGMISGLSLSHDIGHLWRALLESYAYAIRHHVEVFAEAGAETSDFRASDGGSNSRIWMQIVADVLQQPLRLAKQHPGSCLGAAWTAAMGVGGVDEWCAITAMVGEGKTISPQRENAAAYADGYAAYRDFYRRMRGFET